MKATEELSKKTSDDLAQAEASLEQARADYNEQRRLREQERESVIRQLERVEERNDVTGILAEIFGTRDK